MNYKLLKEGDPILAQVAEPWDYEKDGSPEELVKNMAQLMFLHTGIGLAAPQIGVSKRVFVMGNPDHLVVCVNPEVMFGIGNEVMDREGCLSFPDLWLRVKRHEKVRVKYQMLTNEVLEEELDGLAARVFQHERDHLDGITFDMIVAKLALQLAKEKRKKKKR